MRLVLIAWGIGSSDDAFILDFIFFTPGEIVSFEGATPVFVNSDTFNMNSKSIEKAMELLRKKGYSIRK